MLPRVLSKTFSPLLFSLCPWEGNTFTTGFPKYSELIRNNLKYGSPISRPHYLNNSLGQTEVPGGKMGSVGCQTDSPGAFVLS